MTTHKAAICSACGTPTVPCDTEPWPEMNEITYVYECQCGNVWTEAIEEGLK